MTELTAAESSVLNAIESSPGISAMDLSKQLQRRTQEVLRTVEALVGKGQAQRQPVKRTRIDGKEHRYNGLFVVSAPPVPLDPNVCPTCGARRRHFEGGAECRATVELRELGRTLDWQRVPYGYGKAIQTGEAMWDQFLNSAALPSMAAATRHAKEWASLNDQIRRQYAATSTK